MEDKDLDMIPTVQLMNALRRRSKVFFAIMRPIIREKEYDRQMFWGTNGKLCINEEGDIDRIMGLIELGKIELVKPEKDSFTSEDIDLVMGDGSDDNSDDDDDDDQT